jgi:glycosyltransferase involved in cell wall biosynthesis
MARLAHASTNVRCFYNDRNRGLGATVRRLFRDAAYPHIICMDCDLPFTENVIPCLLVHAADHAIVVASRYQQPTAGVIWYRRWLSRMYYGFCKFLFDVPVKDLGSGSFYVRKAVIPALDLRADGFDFHVEFYAKARKQGLSVKEVAMPVNPRPTKGSFRLLKHGLAVIPQTVRLWCRERREAEKGGVCEVK